MSKELRNRQDKISDLLNLAQNITNKLEQLSKDLEFKDSAYIYKRKVQITKNSNFT